MSFFYEDKYQRDGRSSACRKCRSKQISRAKSLRTMRKKGYFAPEPNLNLFHHNFKALYYLQENDGFKPGACYKTKIKGAIKAFDKGFRVGTELIHVKTVKGERSIDPRRSTLVVIARFLENNNVKLLIEPEDSKKLLTDKQLEKILENSYLDTPKTLELKERSKDHTEKYKGRKGKKLADCKKSVAKNGVNEERSERS